MTEDDVAIEVVAWARDVITDLQEGRSWLTAQKTQLPDVVVDVGEKAIRLSDDRFPTLDIEQVAIRVFEVEAAFMVESANDPGADETETKQLREFGSLLVASLLNDGTLGSRVFAATPIGATFNYRLPFVQYEDGTRGRQMTFSFAVGEPVGAIDA